MPDAYTLVGASIVIASSVYVLHAKGSTPRTQRALGKNEVLRVEG